MFLQLPTHQGTLAQPSMRNSLMIRHPTPSALFLEAVSVLFVLTQVQTHLLFFAADPKADQRVNEFQ